MHRGARILLAVALSFPSGCEPPRSDRDVDPGLVDLALRSVRPGVVIPQTRIVVEGDSFVDDPWGRSELYMRGSMTRPDGSLEALELRLPARFVDYERLEIDIDNATFEQFGGDGHFEAFARVEVQSSVDGRLYRSVPIDVVLDVESALDPDLALLQSQGVIFPNEPLQLEGAGLLLTSEGESLARLSGCFTEMGSDTCVEVGTTEVPIVPADPLDRSRGTFAFVPAVAGIEPGRFEGHAEIVNVHASGESRSSPAQPVVYDLERPILYGVDVSSASLGQYVTIDGAGFVGGSAGGDTTLRFVGTFTPERTGLPVELDELLIPEVVDGRTIRYVINEDDALGQRLDVRFEAGRFEGTVTPEIAWQSQTIVGDPSPFSFDLAPVKQVVHVRFLPGYRESLRHFGLRAVDDPIEARVLEVVRRDFTTINVDIRTEAPTDFALYAQVDVSGPDPNGLGLLGYDNTPGKDTENLRLYDRIGGVNALTQEDGFPGYGGVFIESLFGYSADPGEFAEPLKPAEEFDQIFDPFRPDRGGTPVLADDFDGDLPTVGANDCPADAKDRPKQIACAIYVLGNLIGTTVSHELGHSVGLADPYGPFFHNGGDQPDRLMDADRPFGERAELGDEGPSVFCVDEYEYLREILPTGEAYDITPRPPCF